MKTTFYVYKVGNSYIKIGKTLPFKLTLFKDIDKASYWSSKESVNSWKSLVERKYPKAKLVECGICER